MNMNNLKIMNLLNMRKTIKMNGKKRTTIKTVVKSKMSMKDGIEANTKLNMKMTRRLNVMLQMGMRCCRFAGYLNKQIKPARAERTAKVSAWNKLCSGCAADPTGPMSKHMCEQSVETTPVRRLRPSCPGAWVEAKATSEESDLYLITLPKISHAELQALSVPA
jgi:hypothetical protein